MINQDVYTVKFDGGAPIATFGTLSVAKAFCLGMCYQAQAIRQHLSCAGILVISYNNELVRDCSFNLAHDYQ